MASSSHAPKNHSSSSSSSSINKPHTSFFRVILPYILEEKKLKLPLKFVGRYGSELSSVANLYLPDGYAWKVGVEKKMKEDGKQEEVWLSKGWGEFMEHHSISEGFFVVFQYRGHSAFDVEIFDLTSSCSIAYPHHHHHHHGEESGFHSEDIVVISDDEDEKDDKFGGEIEKLLERLKASGIVTSHWFYKMMRKMYKNCSKGIEDAILAASNPAHHPSFILLLRSDQIQGKCRPVMPISFARQHILNRGNSTSVVLQMSSGKQWTVVVEKDRKVKAGSCYCVSFGKGWRQFMEDNNLGVADVCLFQLVSPPDLDLLMDVSIFPAH
ncbi:B3 domain-containing protein At4g01580 [Linum grandiflorum]